MKETSGNYNDRTDIGDLTFEILDHDRGYELPPAPPEGEYPLPKWYRRVRNTRLKDLTVEDICRACRQEIYPVCVVPLALRLLNENPLTGEMYDGELIAAMGSIDIRYWRSQPAFREKLEDILQSARASAESDIREDIERLLRQLDQARSR